MMNGGRLREVLERQAALPEDEGVDKVTSLREAVARHVSPGACLYFGLFHSRAYAVAYEIARQHWGKRPGFELVGAGMLEYAAILLHGGLVRKVVAAFCGDTYPAPSPNRAIQRAYRRGEVAFEQWTNLTIPLRLMAGALDLPFMPTRSLADSTLAQENRDAYAAVADPFGEGEQVGVVPALRPDLAIVHGFAADRQGNTVVLGPWGEEAWGVLASRRGALVTVERLVSTEFIRRHSHLVKVPGHLVRSVSVVPFGAHPQPMTNLGLEEFPSYAEDYEFRLELRKATKDPAALDAWIRAWVLDCPSHDAYVARLGRERLRALTQRSEKNSWRERLEARLPAIPLDPTPTINERMLLAAARGIRARVLERNLQTVLAGAGLAALAAWLAVDQLKREGHPVELVAESGFYGFSPRPGDPYVFSYWNIPTNKMQSDFVTLLGSVCGGPENRCLAVIGAAEVDARGNVNSTRLADGTFLVGSGGANDLGSTAAEVFVLSQQDPRRFVARTAYTTTVGRRVTRLFSDMGVFEKQPGTGSFRLAAVVPDGTSTSLPEQVERIRARCGWPLEVSPEVAWDERPGDDELLALRLYDPDRLLLD